MKHHDDHHDASLIGLLFAFTYFLDGVCLSFFMALHTVFLAFCMSPSLFSSILTGPMATPPPGNDFPRPLPASAAPRVSPPRGSFRSAGHKRSSGAREQDPNGLVHPHIHRRFAVVSGSEELIHMIACNGPVGHMSPESTLYQHYIVELGARKRAKGPAHERCVSQQEA